MSPEEILAAREARQAEAGQAEPPKKPRHRREGLPPIFKATDLGNSERFVAQHGVDLRHATGIGWMFYDGKRWRRDDTGERFRRAKRTVRSIYREAAEIEDEAIRRAMAEHAKKSETASAIAAMVKLAESDAKIAIRAEDLDADPWALNVGNGTIDLRAGKLRPHRREDLITKLAPVAYDPEAKAPAFDAFIASIFAGDAELVRFVQCFVGYALTGDVREQVLFFAHGMGRNGKSTLLELLLAMLGDYAMTAAPGLLVARAGEAHPTERADLFGSRLVTCVEIGDGKRWNEELVKQLTGGDTIKARLMRQDFFSFRPTHKLFISANHRPTVKGTDHAIWRRIRLVPFAVQFDGEAEDKALPGKLRAELPGVLRWAVEGCLEWQAEGLGLPASVQAATKAYRAEQDVLGQFIEERCVSAPHATVTASALYADYTEWARGAGENPVTQKAFGMALGERGYVAERTKHARIWRGIGVTHPGGVTHGDAGSDITELGDPREGEIWKNASSRVIGPNASSNVVPLTRVQW